MGEGKLVVQISEQSIPGVVGRYQIALRTKSMKFFVTRVREALDVDDAIYRELGESGLALEQDWIYS